MTNRHFRFSIRHLFVLMIVIAGASAALVSFGPHILWASKQAVAKQYLAFANSSDSAIDFSEELAPCTFNGLSFSVPKRMVGSAKIIRSLPGNDWLVFKDSTRMLQIPLMANSLRTVRANAPPELRDLSTPGLLERCISTASDEFSIKMSKAELRIHDWAIRTRGTLNLDAQGMDRYLRMSSEDIDLILISSATPLLDLNRRIRSILIWESTDQKRSGSIWFGDSRNAEAVWIDAVARSIAVNSEDRLATADLTRLSDTELLSRLSVTVDK